MERILNIAAAVITIGNFFWSLINFPLAEQEEVFVETFPISYLPLRLIFFLSIEFILSYTFAAFMGILLSKGRKDGDTTWAFPIFITSLVSAWVSIFNLQKLIIGSFRFSFFYIIKYTLGILFLNAIAAIMLTIVHYKVMGKVSKSDHETVEQWLFFQILHSIPFLIQLLQ